MHAIRQRAFGTAEELRYEEIADPLPAAGQVRIAVAAAGVHLLDVAIRQGFDGGPFPPPALPMTPGREVAGLIDATGPGVDERWLGRRAVAHLGAAGGGYAELALAGADDLIELPDGLPAEDAVAMVGTGRTTMGVLDVASLRADDVVLVTAAAGGMGSLLVQAARNVGAVVIGAAGGARKVARVRELGADVAVDYTQVGWAEEVLAALGERAVTVVLESVGGEVGRAALGLLAPGGRIVLFGGSSGAMTELTTDDLYARGVSAAVAIGPRLLARPGGLRPLAERAIAAVAAGELIPATHRFALEDAPAAHTALEGRATMGKVVLVP